MSLFVNQNIYPKLYKTKENLLTINQSSSRYSLMQDFIERQQQHNQNIAKSIKGLNHKIERHETPMIKMMERIQQLEELNKNLLEHMQDNEIVKEAIMAQLSFQKEATLKQTNKIEEYEQIYLGLQEQQESQQELHAQLLDKLSLQEAFHQTILEQIEHQHKSTQKIADKVDYLKDLIVGKVISFKEKISSIAK